MPYRERPPPAPLRGLVECAWSDLTDGPPQLFDVLPDGCMDLVWTGDELLVAGPDTAPHPAQRVPGHRTAGLRFAPGRLPALLGAPASAVLDRRAPLAELHPRLAGRAVARLERGDPPPEVLADLTLALPGPLPTPAVAAVLAHVRSGASAATVADALGCTTRSLHRHSLTWFGYGPAVLRRVLRFRRASALLRAGVTPADVAARAGYADQPHLSREVRALAGTAPGRLAGGQLASGANRSTPFPSGSWTTAYR